MTETEIKKGLIIDRPSFYIEVLEVVGCIVFFVVTTQGLNHKDWNTIEGFKEYWGI